MTSGFTRYRIASLLLVGCFMFFLGAKFDRGHAHVEKCSNDVVYVNADVACGRPDVIKKTGYIETRNHISELIEKAKKESGVVNASVYFRDLVHGPVLSISELEEFAPASLLKLPLAFVYFSAAEDQSGVMAQKINYGGTTTLREQRIQPRISAESGREYSIEELLKMMLVHSDNASYEVLEQFLSDSPGRMTMRTETFQEVGLIDPKDRVEATITVRGYASLFRILSWLSETEYKAGLVAGVPTDVKVAHKFGERLYANDVKELHDCGIIYFPENPYLLCVMTRGSDFAELENLIREISRTVYQEVDSRRLQ
jgi:beta-lactamase class A